MRTARLVVDSGAWGTRCYRRARHRRRENLVATMRRRRRRAGARRRAHRRGRATSRWSTSRSKNQPVAKLGSVDGIEPGTPIGVLGYPVPDAFEDEHLRRTVSLYTAASRAVRVELGPVIRRERGRDSAYHGIRRVREEGAQVHRQRTPRQGHEVSDVAPDPGTRPAHAREAPRSPVRLFRESGCRRRRSIATSPRRLLRIRFVNESPMPRSPQFRPVGRCRTYPYGQARREGSYCA